MRRCGHTKLMSRSVGIAEVRGRGRKVVFLSGEDVDGWYFLRRLLSPFVVLMEDRQDDVRLRKLGNRKGVRCSVRLWGGEFPGC